MPLPLTLKDLELITQRRRHHNRPGFAVQLAVLHFPGRPLRELAGVPPRVLAAIADQVQVPASAFSRYGDRDQTQLILKRGSILSSFEGTLYLLIDS